MEKSERLLDDMPMKTLYVTVFSALFLFGCIFSGFSYDWPVEDRAVTATFGENRWGHFHGGIDIGGGEQEIHPIESGEIIYFFEENDDPRGIPTGLGNFVVVEHERGIRSLYAHMRSENRDNIQISVTKEDVLGIIGESGSALGKHLHLEVFDGELNRLVNPLELLPELSDSTTPDIEALYLEQDGTIVRLGPNTAISTGLWILIIDAYDTSNLNGRIYPIAPYRVLVYLNGREEISLPFESLEEDGRNLVLSESGHITDEELYVEDWKLRVGKLLLQEGEMQLEVIVRDIAGNEAIETTWISVSGK